MEVLERKEQRSITGKPGVFNLNSKGEKGDTKQVKFKNQIINGKKAIVIASSLLEKDNFNVIHAGARITLMIMEKKNIERPRYIHNVKLIQPGFSYYERLKSYDYTIPDDYHVHTDIKWNECNKTVEVYFR